ncbi:hypothetical protein OH76DRAFT_1253202 [Lentinus brumalis]|uniref:Uncharacterized protein n=1 Tax=Lentinus brumalis TaxID=2498619 RepID=A0A371CRS4_9APHY|nr:hypothetical protein OH76DRAFT_1253202 [Polyporus brumalis]
MGRWRAWTNVAERDEDEMTPSRHQMLAKRRVVCMTMAPADQGLYLRVRLIVMAVGAGKLAAVFNLQKNHPFHWRERQ